jgi:serine/threonine protein kinase/tetratricopeptide (TPR) repeat protein
VLNDPSAWARIAPYLDQALDLEPRERAAWLDEMEKTQAEVAHTLRRLLSEREALKAKAFLHGSLLPLSRVRMFLPALKEMLRHRGEMEAEGAQEPLSFAPTIATERRPADVCEGAVLGSYRLLREIGHGGMSSVWLAERCDGQLKRQVALKLPFEGPRRAQMAERFERERDILATLTHPNIARLYDAGVSASGQSYLAMEYVNGTAFTRYCNAARLSIRERLKIFLQVLAAVEFAHTHLVLHRDLKPSNILVTPHGRVVLLDFGIAKLLSREAAPESPPTEMVGRMLTLDYASPEHIDGHALGTTSDVYSLGVVLYELLAGERPHGSRHESQRALQEAILTRDPPRPSQLTFTNETAAARHTTPRKLAQVLQGDLDTVILKALKRAPAGRYQSIDAFGRDITNYLGNRPVSARPDSAWYRSCRFVMRYRWQVATATVALLAIVVGGAVAVWQARVAALQRDRAVALSSRNASINGFMSMLVTEAASSEKPVTVSEMIARSEKLALASDGGNREDRAAILETIALLHYRTSDDVGKSAQLLQRALALVGSSRDSGLRSRLTCLHAMMIADMGEIDAAIRNINRELDSLKSDHENSSRCFSNLAHIAHRAGGDAQDMLRYATLALDHFRQAGTNAAFEEGELLGAVAYGHNLRGDNVQANRYYELALQKYTEAGSERSPGATVLVNNWALASAGAGVPKRALELYDHALGIVTERDPGVRPPAPLIFNRGRTLEAIGRYAQAKEAYQLGLQLSEQSKSLTFQVTCLFNLASIAEQSGDRSAAARHLQEGVDLLGASLSAYGGLKARRAVIQGRLYLADRKLDEARAQFDLALGRNRKNESSIDAALGKAEVELLAGNATAAMVNARIALDMAASLQGGVPHSNYAGLSWLMLGRALQARGEVEPARQAFQSAVTHLANTVDADHPALVRARRLSEDRARREASG